MKLINNLLSGKKDKDALKLRFIKKENIWHVTKGYAIMYMGDKDQCERYLSNMTV